jgi:modulator of FtsH protease HflC
VVLLVLFVFMLFTFQVRQTEVAVVTSFGKYSRSITNAGFQLRWPWPVEKVYEFDRRLQVFESKFDQSLTRDQILILSKLWVGWRIAGDARVFLERYNGDALAVARVLEPVVRNAKDEVLGRHDFSDLISTNRAALKFDQIEAEILGQVQGRARQDYGIEVDLLGIKQLGLPESVTTSVFERMKAERQRLISRYQAEGEREAKIIRSRADGQANEILADARGQAIRITGEAELKAQEFYSVFEKNPELAVFLFQLRALELSLKDRAHLILDQQTPPFNLLDQSALAAPAASRSKP